MELGFSAAGIAAAAPLDANARFEAWLAAGHHASMSWIATERSRRRRADIAALLRDARSVICVALGHETSRDEARDRRLGRIARYAAGEDYHRVMRDKLRTLQAFVCDEALPGARALWYVDTGAILERGWAEAAGLGWIGKHAGLLSETGSWFLLGELVVDAPLAADAPVVERCGTCTRCLDACPTHAIVAPYQVDARLCISYLTIEHHGPIPLALRPAIGDWVFGCDICQEVCPWNRFAPPAREARMHARSLEGWTPERFLTLDEARFRELFDVSPIRRAGREGLVRNVCVALGNRGSADAAPALMRTLRWDVSPVVRGHAAWALGAIGRRGVDAGLVARIREALGRAARSDADASVREEAERAQRAVPRSGAANDGDNCANGGAT